MTDHKGKCYSQPPKTAIDRKIDSAFDKAYREIYMGQPQARSSRDEYIAQRSHDVLDAAYEDAQRRKANAWKDDADLSPRDAFLARRYGQATIDEAHMPRKTGQTVEDDAQHTTKDAQVQRDAAYQEFRTKRYGTTDSIEDAYEAAQVRKQNAWKDDAQAQAARDKARNDFLACRYGREGK